MVLQAERRQALRADRALSSVQLARLGLETRGLATLTLSINPLANSTPQHDVTFCAFSAVTLRREVRELPHLCGLAAVRQILELGPESWQLGAVGASVRPDAVATIGGEAWAVEFDAGYSRGVIERKMRAFTSSGVYAGTVWATTSPLRAQRLQARYPAARVLCVDYWSIHQT